MKKSEKAMKSWYLTGNLGGGLESKAQDSNGMRGFKVTFYFHFGVTYIDDARVSAAKLNRRSGFTLFRLFISPSSHD